MRIPNQTDVRFVPYEKLSKKKKKEVDQLKRTTWDIQNPCTRKMDGLLIYKRKRKYEYTLDQIV